MAEAEGGCVREGVSQVTKLVKILSGPKDCHIQKDGDPDKKIGGPDFRYGKAEYSFKRICYILKLTIPE